MATHEDGRVSMTKRHLSNEFVNFGSLDIGDEKLLFWCFDGDSDYPSCEITSDEGPMESRLWNYSTISFVQSGTRFGLSPKIDKIIKDHPELKVIELNGLNIRLPGVSDDNCQKILSVFLDKLKSYLGLDYILTSPIFETSKNKGVVKLGNQLKKDTQMFIEKYGNSSKKNDEFSELDDIKKLSGIRNNENI